MDKRTKFPGPVKQQIEFFDGRLLYLIEEYGNALRDFFHERGGEIDQSDKAAIYQSLCYHGARLLRLSNVVEWQEDYTPEEPQSY